MPSEIFSSRNTRDAANSDLSAEYTAIEGCRRSLQIYDFPSPIGADCDGGPGLKCASLPNRLLLDW